jgi:selenocysteine-specific elongation factor
VDEETVELAQLEVVELFESVGLEPPIFPVSGVTGEGVGELLAALDELAARSENARVDTLARLPVDRAFVLKGIGLVATGTLWSGEIRAGDTLYTSAGYHPRVRSIQNHGRATEVARAGARTALDLVGIEAAELEPGDVLLSSPVPPTRAFDARLELLESAPPLRHGTRLRLYHGTRATNARVRFLDRQEVIPGESVPARLVSQEGLVVLPGDRFVLRSSSPQLTVGGGTVLDSAPIGRKPELGWLEALESGDLSRVVPLALARAPKWGMAAQELSLIVPAAPAEISAAARDTPQVAQLGELYALGSEVEAAQERLLEALKKRAEDRPESPELSVAESRTATELETRLADALLAEMAEGEDPRIRFVEAGVSLPDADEVPPKLEKEAQELLGTLRGAGVEPPVIEVTPAARLLLKRGQAVRLADGLFADEGVAESVLEEIKSTCRVEGEISLAGFRDLLGTSRKYAQAWLEYADSAGVTRRVGDARILTRRHL